MIPRTCKICGAELGDSYLPGVTTCLECTMKKAAKEQAIDSLQRLDDETRLEVFGMFCSSCGCEDPTCNCGRDE